jgi:hypothetical protein
VVAPLPRRPLSLGPRDRAIAAGAPDTRPSGRAQEHGFRWSAPCSTTDSGAVCAGSNPAGDTAGGAAKASTFEITMRSGGAC